MAKKDSGPIYLRATCESGGAGTFTTTNIDVSAYVDPLDGKVLRVKQVWGEWASDNGGTIKTADVGVDVTAAAMAQLTSVSQTSIKPMTNSSLFFKTQLYCATDNQSGTNNLILMREDNAMNPADYADGFFVASDVIQVGVHEAASPHGFAAPVEFQVLIEAERVRMSEKDAFSIISTQQQD